MDSFFELRQADEGVVYDAAHAHGVISLAVAGFLSGLAVLAALLVMLLRPSVMSKTQITPYFLSLLAANLVQAVGGCLNLRWVINRTVDEGLICSIQGVVKQAGNVGTAVWSLVLSVCVFNLMFLRSPTSSLVTYLFFGAGWCAVALIVAIGPLAIQSPSRGPYFGPSGYWCWITDEYPVERTFLEYFFEFFSAGVSFLLYVAILLRVRGNLMHGTDAWHLRFVPSSERWQLAINRDWIDTSMMGVAALLMWYPVAYSVLLIPVAIVRFIGFGGGTVPFAVTIVADTLFNLQGLLNAILLFATCRFYPTAATGIMGVGAVPRKVINMSSPEAVGITPYVLTSSRPRASAGVSNPLPFPRFDEPQGQTSLSPLSRRTSTTGTFMSVDSRTPLHRSGTETP